MKYLDLTAEQSAALAAGQVVEVWERMEPQPVPAAGRFVYDNVGGFLPETQDGRLGVCNPSSAIPPHPPGTRARVREECWIDDPEATPLIGCRRAFFASDGWVLFEDGRKGGHEPAWEAGMSDVAWMRDRMSYPGGPPHCTGNAIPDWAIRMDATSTTTRPEQRDGVWGFVTEWVINERKD